MAFVRKSRDPQATGSRIGYQGEGFAPAPGTYLGINPFGFFSLEDTGITEPTPALRALAPLIAAALYETGFAWEAGPLSTWSN